MNAKLFVPEKLPEWFKIAAADSLISMRDATVLFGYKSEESVKSSMDSGQFPQPDMPARKAKFGCSNHGPNKNLWKKSTLLAEVRRRQKHNQSLCVCA